ncbi:MAG: PEGA domain-containing protein [Planctomycetales bacterium]|nr:PEGA domain-containing protein [Planctomycetales bacterium]
MPTRSATQLDFAAAAQRCVRWCFVLAMVFLATTATGCVRRRLLIRSNPPGATVYVDNQPIGVTPCATSFIYYGTREIRLVKPGYETLTINQPIPAPWYEIPPFDFVSENVVTKEIQDYRTVSFNLTPQVIVPTETLIGRADQLRQATLTGGPLPADAGVPLLPPSLGQAPLGPPTIITPDGQTTLAPQGVPAPMLAPEYVAPGVALPTTPGAGLLPPGGQVLEPLPPAR